MLPNTLFKTIVVPVDGSPFSEWSLPLASRLAERTGAELHLVRVASSHVPGGDIEASAYLKGLADCLAAIGPIRLRTVVLSERNPTAAIAAYAERVEGDLVAMTTHGRGALGAFWHGSISYDMLASMRLPILFIHPPPGAPDLTRAPIPKRMLIVLDGSPSAERVLGPAVALCAAFAVDFTLLQVIDAVPFGRDGLDSLSMSSLAPGVGDQIEQVQNQVRQKAIAYLESVAQRLRENGRRVETQVQASFDPTEAIIKVIEERMIDVVALESSLNHDQHGVGNIARRIIHEASIPVFV